MNLTGANPMKCSPLLNFRSAMCDHTWYKISARNIVMSQDGTSMEEEYVCTTCGDKRFEPVFLFGVWPEW